jgi:hypothetical protein
VDEEKSDVKIEYDPQSNKKVYSITGCRNVVFSEQAVGSARIFRMRYLWPVIICDQNLKDACREVGTKGTWFREAIR